MVAFTQLEISPQGKAFSRFLGTVTPENLFIMENCIHVIKVFHEGIHCWQNPFHVYKIVMEGTTRETQNVTEEKRC